MTRNKKCSKKSNSNKEKTVIRKGQEQQAVQVFEEWLVWNENIWVLLSFFLCIFYIIMKTNYFLSWGFASGGRG